MSDKFFVWRTSMKNDNVKKLTATDLENLVYDLIKFCKA